MCVEASTVLRAVAADLLDLKNSVSPSIDNANRTFNSVLLKIPILFYSVKNLLKKHLKTETKYSFVTALSLKLGVMYTAFLHFLK
jgi:hypothetical protein